MNSKAKEIQKSKSYFVWTNLFNLCLPCSNQFIICDPEPQNQSYASFFFFSIEIKTSSESWINKLSIDAWFVRIGQYLAELFENLESEGPIKLSKWGP